MTSHKKLDLKNNKAFCVIPWLHLHVMPDSSVIPCCVSPYENHYGNVSKSDVNEIWNNEKFRELRSQMLKGELPPGCVHCHDLEKAGFLSMREKLNKRFDKDISHFLINTAEDGSYTEFKLKYIDIRFSNLCNLKCRGCGPPLSSSWYDDYTEFHGKKPEGPKVKSISADSPEFWKIFQEKMLDAEEVYFGGGEPLITKEHFDVLRLLIAKGKTDVQLSYNTNLSTLTYGNHNLADLWSHFKNVTLGISIDDIGPRAEYFRSGTKWNVFEKNLFTMRDHYKSIRRYINCTVNVTNVFYLPELYTYLYNEKIMDSESFNFNLLLGPEEYRIDAIPLDSKLKIKAKLDSFTPFLEERKLFKVAEDFKNIVIHMMKEDNSYLHSRFLSTTQKMDSIRGESFVDTYPELADVLNIKKSDHEIPILYKPNMELRKINDELPSNISIAVYDHHHYFEGQDRQLNLMKRTLPTLETIPYSVINEWEWDAFLDRANNEGKDFAVIMAAGLVTTDHISFLKGLTEACNELQESDWPALGHLLDFNDGKLLPYFHEQFVIVNLKCWEKLGKIPLGSLFTNIDDVMQGLNVSDVHLHSNYTPSMISSGGNAVRNGKAAFGSLLIKAAIENGKGVFNINKPIWNVIRYAYPRDENVSEKEAVDKIIKQSDLLKESSKNDDSVAGLFKIPRFNPKRFFSLNSNNLDAQVYTNYSDLKNKEEIKTFQNVTDLLKTQEKFILLIGENSISTDDLIKSLKDFAQSQSLRLFRHGESRNFLLGKGLDFVRAIVWDSSNQIEDKKIVWKEFKL